MVSRDSTQIVTGSLPPIAENLKSVKPLSYNLSLRSINLVPAQAGKVTVGLALHWPYVTDNSGMVWYTRV